MSSKKLWRQVAAVRIWESKLENESDEQLSQRLQQYRSNPSILSQVDHRNAVLALAIEALKRTEGIRLYDVQVFASLILTHGGVAEMQTGEGKTFSVLPAAVYFSLFGRGVHVATTNPYLASRDREIVLPALRFLGITCGLIEPAQPVAVAATAYSADITYGPGYQFGFDYLRDQLLIREQSGARLGDRTLRKLSFQVQSGLIQRPLVFAIIDEIDSVLLDEATTPLLLATSGPKLNDQVAIQLANRVATKHLTESDYAECGRGYRLTSGGMTVIHDWLKTQSEVRLNRPWAEYVESALAANLQLNRNEDYVVVDNLVQIVDQNTGRILPDQTWKNGLHQAVEIKEGVPLTDPTQTAGTITRQRLYSKYALISGLTGTVAGHQAEFDDFYRMPIQQVPPNRKSRRKQLPSRCFTTKEQKWLAIIDDTRKRSLQGQPVLIGTRTIAESLEISKRLVEQNISHHVLNGIQDKAEAQLISAAGAAGAVTVSTNIAGRGTDIKLDDQATKAGGLHVIVSQPHDSTRIDRQLIGRCARQGEPGSYQCYISADDQILTGTPLAEKIRRAASHDHEVKKDFSVAVRNRQLQLESESFSQRREMKQQETRKQSTLEALFDTGESTRR